MLRLLGNLAYKLFNVQIRYLGNWKRDYKWLIDYKYRTIIDIGANEGQFAMKMRQLFPAAAILSFEPIPFVYEKLKENFAGDPSFTAFPYGLADVAEKTTFFLNENSESSSLLPMKDHKVHFNKAVKAVPIEVEIRTLDDVLQEQSLNGPTLIKIDVQGAEDRVIMGGKNILKQADVIICEVSFLKLYEGQKLFRDIYELLTGMGFSYEGNLEQLHSPVNNQVLQADAIFVRRRGDG